jgi:hypothetical protein
VRLSFPKYLCAAALMLLAACVPARADYVVLRSGARLNVTGYEILGDRYRLHLQGGVAEVPVADIVAIEPEEIFEPSTEPLTLTPRSSTPSFPSSLISIPRPSPAKTPAA